uniref:KH domain-containing protein n=2 Tax=Ascaris TaxID=6251 RepID=A0A0M3HRQ0_ASCLU
MANDGKSNDGLRADASNCRGAATGGVERGSPHASMSCHPAMVNIDFTSPPPAPGTREEQNDAARYLDELVRDMRKLNAIQKTSPSLFLHARYLLTSEMDRIWNIIYRRSASSDHQSHSPQDYQNTPVEQQTITLQEKVPIPQATGCNYICRILGPRGKTVRRLEAESGCHILIRGEGSLKNPRRESRLKKYAGWEHLLEPLHVLVIAFDVNKANCMAKLAAGVAAVTQLINAGADSQPPPQLLRMPPINLIARVRSEAIP